LDKWRDFTWAKPYASLLSYSFANRYPLISNSPENNNDFLPPPRQPSDFALAADANNSSEIIYGITTYPSSPRVRQRAVNSRNHRSEGQNVLYLDGHVSWKETIFCSYGGDAIYYADYNNGRYNRPETGPATRYDSAMRPDVDDWDLPWWKEHYH